MDHNNFNMGWGWASTFHNALEKDPKKLNDDVRVPYYWNLVWGMGIHYVLEKDPKNEIMMVYKYT